MSEPAPTAPAPAPAPVAQPPVEPPAEPAAPPAKNLPTFTPGLQVFLRGEGRLNPDFNATGGAEHQAAVLERIRLHLAADWGPVSGFVQFQDARSWGFEASTISNEANTDLHQGWLQIAGSKGKTSGYIRLGRQEINVGNQRLIGALLWAPTARAFDALYFHGQHGKLRLDLFGAMLQPPGVVTAPDPMDPTITLTANSAGAQLVGLVFGADIHKAIGLEFVGLYDRADARNGALAFRHNIANTGLRVFGSPVDGLKYDFEGNVQFGNNLGLQHFAWAWSGRVDYVYGKPKAAKPGGFVGYQMGSGDDCTGDPAMAQACGNTESHEFFNFYPTNHLFYGFMDLFGWRNIRTLEAGLNVAIPEVIKLIEVKYHFFQLNNPTGRWSNAGGANVGAGWDPTNTQRTLGHEVDLYAVIKPWKSLFIQPGYGVFIPTGVGRLLGGDDPQHFIWLWMTLDF